MAKTIVQRILAETRARLQQREGLDRVRSGSSLGEPALLDELMRRFATEVAPMLSQLVAKEFDRAFRSMPTPPSALAPSPYGSEFAAPRPASDSDAIRNIADLFDPDAPDPDAGSPASGESDLGFPLEELKKQLESIMADTELGSDVSILHGSDSTELGTTLSSVASKEERDESDPGNHDSGLRSRESAPTQQIPNDEIDQVRRESSNPPELIETPGEETQQITTVLDEFFRDPDDEERIGASGAEKVGLRDSAQPPGLLEYDNDDDGNDESVRREEDETDSRSPQDAPQDEGDTSVDSEAARDASTSDDDTPPEAPDEMDILEEIGISLDQKVADYWDEKGQSGLSNEEIVLEFEAEETVLDEGEETEVAGLDPDPSPPEASDPESPREDAMEDGDEVETRPLNLDAPSCGIREGPELEALQQQLRGLGNSDPPVAIQTLELGDSRELGAVVRILQNSQDRLLATIERLAEALSSRVD